MSDISLPINQPHPFFYEQQTLLLPHTTCLRITEQGPTYYSERYIIEKKIDTLRNDFLWVPLNEFIIHDVITPLEVIREMNENNITLHDKQENKKKTLRDLREDNLLDIPDFEEFQQKK